MMNAGVVLIAAVVAADFLVAAGAEGFLTFTGQHDDADIVVIPASASAWIISLTVSGRKALRTCGRLMVILAIPSVDL